MGEIKVFIMLSLMFFGSFVRANAEILMACAKVFAPEYIEEACCDTLNTINIFDDELNGCNTTESESSEEVQCAEVECSLRKQGLMEGGKINEDKVKSYLDEIANKYPKQKHVLDGLKENCLNESYTKYLPKGDCMASKFYFCLYSNVMLDCETWKDTKNCKKASDDVKKCKEELKTRKPKNVGFL